MIPAALAAATLLVLAVTVASGVVARWEGAEEGALRRHVGAAIVALLFGLAAVIAALSAW